jgi:hypothetical protein
MRVQGGCVVLLACVASLSAFSARAADVEGSADHPLVGRYEGAEIGYEVEYDEAALIESPFSPTRTDGGTGFATVEGKVTSSTTRCQRDARRSRFCGTTSRA